MTATDRTTRHRFRLWPWYPLGLILLLGLLPTACRTPDSVNFSNLQAGMTQVDVRQLLGPPSSEWDAPPPEPGRPPLDWTTRWQYGDTLSTTATTALGRDLAPDRVWVIRFNAAGKVIDFRTPIQKTSTFIRVKPPK